MVNNRKKVSVNLLKDEDVKTCTITEDLVVVIHVPMARREERPVYINDDLFGGTYRRNHEGDHRCTRLQVKTMLRDQAEKTMDMEVLDDARLDELVRKRFRDIEIDIAHCGPDIFLNG